MTPEGYLLGVAVIAAVGYILLGGKVIRSSNAPDYIGAQRQPSGLMNLGNTCFFNAVLQALASSRAFYEWLGQYRSVTSEFTAQFYCLISTINNPSNSSSNTEILSNLLDKIRTSGWVTEHTEHDAHELYHAVMHLLHNDLNKDNVLNAIENEVTNKSGIIHRNKAAITMPVVTHSPIQGYLSSSMRCKTCLLKTSTKYDIFSSLSLTFPPNQLSTFHLDDLLRYYFISDNLTEVDCENCSAKSQGAVVKSDFLRELSIGKAPHCLCLHIQRLGWYGHHEALKRHDKIVFPAMLDIRRFTQLYKLINHSNMQLGFPSTHSPPVDLTAQKTPGCWYMLTAVVEHQGSESSGHFVTYRRSSSEQDVWIYTSDLNVSEVTAEFVHSRSPYMLFYERI